MRKKLLAACCALTLGALQIQAQLVAHYTFTNLSGADVSGNNLDGLTAGSFALNDVADHKNTLHEAAEWIGQSGYQVPHNTLLNFTNQISIATWIKPSTFNGTQKIVDKLDGNVTGNFELDIYYGNLRFWVASGHVEVPLNQDSVNTWMHVVAVYSGGYATIYINNVPAVGGPVSGNIGTGNLTTNASDMMIGLDQVQSNNFFGVMDDLRIYGNALSASDIADLYNEIPTTSCLISKWTFDNGNANDEVGTDNGNVNGATLTTDRFGSANKAYSFDGVDDRIDFAGSNFGTSDFAISLWVKADAVASGKILTKVTSGINGGVAIEDLNGVAIWTYVGTTTGTNRVVQSSSTFNTNTWHHIVLNHRSADSTSLYINGVLYHSNTSSIGTGTVGDGSPLLLGTNGQGAFGFNGDIDDINVYNCALTDAEITTLYNDGGWNGATGITEISSINVVNVYPNPANNVLSIEVKEATNIKVVNLLGATVVTQKLNPGSNRLDISALKNGVYFIQSDKGGTVKFIKE